MIQKKLLKQQIESIRHSPWSFFTKKWRLTLVILMALMIGGFISFFSMPITDPEVKIPRGFVTVVFPGASSSNVEKLVTDRLEKHLKNLEDLRLLTSSSSEGFSSILVEFESTADIKDSFQKLKDAVDDAKLELPEDAGEPVAREVRTGVAAILAFSIIGNLSPEDFEFYGEELKERLERLNDVSRVTLLGMEDKEMQILIDIKALEGFGIPLSKVVNIIQANNIDFPIGSILTKDFYYQVSLKGQLISKEALKELPIANINERNIYLKDIAEVREVFAEKKEESKLYQHSTNRYYPSINLLLYKQAGADYIDISKDAKAEVSRFKKEVMPPDADILVTADSPQYVRQDIGILIRSGLQAVVIIFIILFLALGFKEALLTTLSVPFIFLASFLGLYLYGETFNPLILFALIMSFGLIIDTSIVMMEGVHENIKHKRFSPEDSALLAIKTYKDPLTSSTLTTVSAFIPLALMTGYVGQFFKHVPVAVITTLLASLLIGVAVLPAVASHVFQKFKYDPHEKPPLLDRIFEPLLKWYAKYIKKILTSKKKCIKCISGMFIASAVAISFPFIGVLKTHMFSPYDANHLVVDIEGPVGLSLNDTLKIAEKVEKFVEELPELENYVTIIGGRPLGLTGFQPKPLEITTPVHKASISINLTKREQRKLKSYEISEILREKVKGITEAKITVKNLLVGPQAVIPIEVRVIGEDVAALESFAEVIKKELKKIPGTSEVSTDIEHGPGEFHFTLKRDQLEYYGLSAAQWGNEIRTAVFGSSGIKILRAGEETPIVVRLDFRDEECKQDKITQILEKRDEITICNLNPKNIDQIKRLLIPTSRGQVPLSELVNIELKPTIATIHHRDTTPVVTVESFVKEGVFAVDVIKALQKRMKEIPIPEGIEIEYGGEMEDVGESFYSLLRAMIIAVLLIIFILVLQFNSFKQPLIILLTLPMASIGAFFGLAILGLNFSYIALFGIVALSGVVVNDAIVFIDRINSNICYGMDKISAIIKAGQERFMPIILTTLTTAAGAFFLGIASEFYGADMAWVIFFGIIFATVLTLMMVPIFYTMLEKEPRESD